MDPEGFPGALFRTWEARIQSSSSVAPPIPVASSSGLACSTTSSAAAALVAARGASSDAHPDQRAFEFGFVRRESKTLDQLFKDYGVRISTLAKMTELGFTVQTLVNMTDQELEDVIKTMLETYHVELLVGEKYGIKSAIRAERKVMDEELDRHRSKSAARDKRRKQDEVPKEGTSKEPQRENAAMVDGSSGHNLKDLMLVGQNSLALVTSIPLENGTGSDSERKRHAKKKQKRKRSKDDGEDGEDRPREHPFIVTEPGELARGKKNGLDYLFDLYEQCGKYLEEVQQQCKERGEKCPTKVTNQVFRHAKHRGASYINKPKMRHYVHCYALHCLDVEQSNHLRKVFKDRGENVGAWRQACYFPLVEMARAFNWDIEGVFSRNDKLRIWYVPTRLRQLCHLEKSKDGQ